MDMNKRLMVALDVPSAPEALVLAEKLAPLGVRFKVGMQLFYAEGISLVRQIQQFQPDTPVFVDLKLHDIPNTVAKAAQALITQGVGFFNVHTQGGEEMMRAAVTAAREAKIETSTPDPIVIGVTVLTSLSETDLKGFLKVDRSLESFVVHLAIQAKASGLQGVVCSAQEAASIRKACGSDFLLVTPGIRPADSAVQDQARIVTPTQALQNGADILVIGRPITGASDPVTAVQRILDEMVKARVPERARL